MEFCALCWMGLENAAEQELSARKLHAEKIRKVRQLIGEGKRKVFFEADPDADTLRQLGTVEDVYAVIASSRNPGDMKGLARMVERALGSETLHAALNLERAVSGRAKAARFEPMITIENRSDMRRRELRDTLLTGVDKKLPKWRRTRRDGIGLWLDIHGPRAMLCVRLVSRRSGKRRDLPGALPASVAYSMIFLTYPWQGEVFADPFCGSGTIILERLRFADASAILGGDADGKAVRTAAENLARTPFVPVRLDATGLPLPDGSVDAIVANPPWGEKHDAKNWTADRLADLYEVFAEEAARVLRHKGRLAIITTAAKSMDSALKNRRAFTISKCFVVNCLGLRPHVFIALRK
ncbi:MAG: methyltransferase domain-containing protein [Planctomycetota bacterium]|nr:MAG: methyltransferase domain-containing protein [Planctomycetota bacterium]